MRPCSLLILLVLALPAAANPTDELLRVVAPDSAFVLVVPNAREHVAKLRASPFAAWFPTTSAGKRLLDSPDVRKLRDAVRSACEQTQTTPETLLEDVLGDAVVFAFHPNKGGDPKDERGLLLIRPSKPDTLNTLIARLNELQTASGELKGVENRTHQGEVYTQRIRAAGPSEFYCSRTGTFGFSTSEDEIRAFLDHAKAAPTVAARRPLLAEIMTRLEVSKAAAVLLVNPRALDAELSAQAARGKPAEQPFLNRFRGYWASLDAAALYVEFGGNLEMGLALLPKEGAKGFFDPGSLVASRLWSTIPEDALFAIAGRQKVSELVEWLGGLMPEEGRRAVRGAVEHTLGPVIGRDKLPLVIEALGPDWGLWIDPPRAESGFLPGPVFALEVQTAGLKGTEAAKALTGAVDYAFQTARVMYNASHPDQIDLIEEKDGEAVVKFLVGDKTFPPGVRPAFALKNGFLLIAGDPDAIRRFGKPVLEGSDEVLLARLSLASLRAYLESRAAPLAKFLAEHTGKPSADIAKQLQEVVEALELFDRLDVLAQPRGRTVRLAARLKLAKMLAK